jgi:hypothetical protein
MMDDNQSGTQGGSYGGYDTPGDEEIISSSSDAVPSPSETSRQRVEAPDSFIGGAVNEKPGDDNPALNETIGYEEGKSSTADLLRARESAEEQMTGAPRTEAYADQGLSSGTSGQVPYDVNQLDNPDMATYDRREFTEPTEPSEFDLLEENETDGPPEDNDDVG